jgi:glyoxylase-like metal-dependent hydrolase (beta-lactamase superfamily II)
MSAPTMIGLSLPDVDVWSERVVVALGQNPGIFTGPGTNTYLVGTGRERILVDTGQGMPAYLPVLERALERAGCRIQEIALTHGHPDHLGGVADLIARFGPLRISKRPHPKWDSACSAPIQPIDDGSLLHSEGATLRAIHTPGHAEDHLCFLLDEEQSRFSGDNVLGVGTTVIPSEGGDLGDYMRSLARLQQEAPRAIYPAHGPKIKDGVATLQEYIDHRYAREREILAALRDGRELITEIVAQVYAAYPPALHGPARHSVCSHLKKLEREGRVRRDGSVPLEARWTPV